jgi:hypothetical protein
MLHFNDRRFSLNFKRAFELILTRDKFVLLMNPFDEIQTLLTVF